jgi:hypothetical protein
MSHLSSHPLTSPCKLLNSHPLKILKSTDSRLDDLEFIAFEEKVGNLHQMLLPYQFKHSVGVWLIKSSGFAQTTFLIFLVDVVGKYLMMLSKS